MKRLREFVEDRYGFDGDETAGLISFAKVS